MSSDALFHDLPDRPGHERYDIDLVSPEVPSGAAWLANCLLELGISAWKPWGADDRAQWQHLEGFRYRYIGGDNGWSRVLPALSRDREFIFRHDRCLRAHHTWPDVHPRTAHTLLFVRDPRDALVSAWHRQRLLGSIPSELDFIAFCRSPFYHYPISWRDHLLLFLRVWHRAVDRFSAKIVRFEDYRADASATLLSVLNYLGVDAASDAVQKAVAASSIERVKAEDLRLLANGVVETLIVRGRPPGEHVVQFDEATHREVGSCFNDICRWLRYAPSPPCPAARARHSQTRVHAAVLEAMHKAGLRVAPGSWLSSAVFESIVGMDLVRSQPV